MTTWYSRLESPIQPLLVTADDTALTGVYMTAHEAGPTIGSDWVEDDAQSVLARARRQLAAYFAGDLQDFDLPLAPRGTPFQRRVWQELTRIPYGTTISYGELARRIGSPGASRAVGLANGRNPIAIIVPCHRVIGSTGRLVGYGGGLPRKEALLRLEGVLL